MLMIHMLKCPKQQGNLLPGILNHAPALAAIVAPTTNSYRRLDPGYEAPVYIASRIMEIDQQLLEMQLILEEKDLPI